MTMRQTFRTCALVLLMATPVAAQTQDEQTQALARLQEQANDLAASVYPTQNLLGYTDSATLSGSVLFVSGWAFDCSVPTADTVVQLELDGVVREAGIIARIDRPDVQAIHAGTCPGVPLKTGVQLAFYMGTFDISTTHSAALRLKTAHGWRRFNVRLFNICGTRPDGSVFCQ